MSKHPKAQAAPSAYMLFFCSVCVTVVERPRPRFPGAPAPRCSCCHGDLEPCDDVVGAAATILLPGAMP